MGKSTTVKIILYKVTPPSWNKFYSGMHWSKRKAIAEWFHQFVWVACKQQKIPKIKTNSRSLSICTTCYFKSRSEVLDPDNICDKLIIDGLKGIVIEDDDYKHIKYVTTESWVDRENPRTEVVISHV